MDSKKYDIGKLHSTQNYSSGLQELVTAMKTLNI